jgi:hypothetical protein
VAVLGESHQAGENTTQRRGKCVAPEGVRQSSIAPRVRAPLILTDLCRREKIASSDGDGVDESGDVGDVYLRFRREPYVGRPGLEPGTNALKGRCSTN